jgi:hypothetical protein
MNVVSLSIILSSPWLVLVALLWPRASRDDAPPPSAAEAARRRLWSS